MHTQPVIATPSSMSSIAASTPTTITGIHVHSGSLGVGVVDQHSLLLLSVIALTNGKSQATFTDIYPCTYELCIGNHKGPLA